MLTGRKGQIGTGPLTRAPDQATKPADAGHRPTATHPQRATDAPCSRHCPSTATDHCGALSTLLRAFWRVLSARLCGMPACMSAWMPEWTVAEAVCARYGCVAVGRTCRCPRVSGLMAGMSCSCPVGARWVSVQDRHGPLTRASGVSPRRLGRHGPSRWQRAGVGDIVGEMTNRWGGDELCGKVG